MKSMLTKQEFDSRLLRKIKRARKEDAMPLAWWHAYAFMVALKASNGSMIGASKILKVTRRTIGNWMRDINGRPRWRKDKANETMRNVTPRQRDIWANKDKL